MHISEKSSNFAADIVSPDVKWRLTYSFTNQVCKLISNEEKYVPIIRAYMDRWDIVTGLQTWFVIPLIYVFYEGI